MIYGAQLGVGYSFNSVTLEPGVAAAFGVPEPVGVSRQQLVRGAAAGQGRVLPASKISLRTQLSYTYTDPDVVIHTVDAGHRPRVAAASRAVEFRGGLLPVQEVTRTVRAKQKGAPSSALSLFVLASSSVLVLFFELFFFGRTEARRRTQRFAVVVERQAGHVPRVHAARGLRVEHDETGLPDEPSRNASRQPQARRACTNPFNMMERSYYMTTDRAGSAAVTSARRFLFRTRLSARCPCACGTPCRPC